MGSQGHDWGGLTGSKKGEIPQICGQMAPACCMGGDFRRNKPEVGKKEDHQIPQATEAYRAERSIAVSLETKDMWIYQGRFNPGGPPLKLGSHKHCATKLAIPTTLAHGPGIWHDSMGPCSL